MARLLLTAAAEREYKRLPIEMQRRVQKLFDGSFAQNPLDRRLNIRAVQKPFVGYRVRIGEYRVLFELGHDTVLVYRIRHRKDAYR